MKQPKLSISADDTIVQEIKAAANDESETVSAWMLDAARAKLRNRALRLSVDAALTDHNLTRAEALAAYEDARNDSTFTGAAS